MTNTNHDARRVAVWVAMADHFLDTESRHDLPLTALRCVEAGLSVAEAREIWMYEVSPAVGFNLLSVAGEWAFWDRDWLIARIERARSSGWRRPGRWRFRLWPALPDQWRAVARCIEHLHRVAEPGDRLALAHDLAFLARHCFDFCPGKVLELESEQKLRLGSLCPQPFLQLIESALLRSERRRAQRVMQLVCEELTR